MGGDIYACRQALWFGRPHYDERDNHHCPSLKDCQGPYTQSNTQRANKAHQAKRHTWHVPNAQRAVHAAAQ